MFQMGSLAQAMACAVGWSWDFRARGRGYKPAPAGERTFCSAARRAREEGSDLTKGSTEHSLQGSDMRGRLSQQLCVGRFQAKRLEAGDPAKRAFF